MRLLVVALLAAVAASSAWAAHPRQAEMVEAELDGDRAREAVVVVRSHSVDHAQNPRFVYVRDRCRGVVRSHRVTRIYENGRAWAQVVEADGRPSRSEVLVAVHAADGGGEAALVHLERRGGSCPRVRKLFVFRPTPLRPGVVRRGFEVYALQQHPSPTLEIAVVERLKGPGRGDSMKITSVHAYDPFGRRYFRISVAELWTHADFVPS